MLPAVYIGEKNSLYRNFSASEKKYNYNTDTATVKSTRHNSSYKYCKGVFCKTHYERKKAHKKSVKCVKPTTT